MYTDNFKWLIGWFQSYEKGASEDFPRIHIGTIANPGWSFCINLKGTGLDEKKFIKVEIDRSDSDWVFCFIKNEFFEGRCGLNNLSEALAIFRNWVENDFSSEEALDNKKLLKLTEEMISTDDFHWLQLWYNSHCDGCWEEDKRIHIYNLLNESGWHLTINLVETEMENVSLEPANIYKSEDDWISCCKINKIFELKCSLKNLFEALGIFRSWVELNN